MDNNCCQFCEAPKRYPGCHDKCAEFIASTENRIKEKNAINAERFKGNEASRYGIERQLNYQTWKRKHARV